VQSMQRQIGIGARTFEAICDRRARRIHKPDQTNVMYFLGVWRSDRDQDWGALSAGLRRER
jgi:hypothetical protein